MHQPPAQAAVTPSIHSADTLEASLNMVMVGLWGEQ